MGVGSLGALRPAVFFDRDGVLNKAIIRDGRPYPPASLADLELVPGVREALDLLRRHDVALIVVSNQPDVARGTASRESVERINAALTASLGLETFFVCYHDDDDRCSCRKPEPGLFFEAAERQCVDLAASFAIGDRWRDVDSAARAGVRSVFIDYGYDERRPSAEPSITVESVLDAARWIVAELSSGAQMQA